MVTIQVLHTGTINSLAVPIVVTQISNKIIIT